MSFYHLNPNRRGERLARRLERHDDYRVLRRLPRPDELWCRSMPISSNVITLAVVDCETTGLDPERHRMIEFAVGTLSIDADHGDVVDVTPPKSWLEDPADYLSIEIERLMSPNDLAWRSVDRNTRTMIPSIYAACRRLRRL